MTASEFAFLALGLVLGVASGAALIEVLRARPSAAREVRVTVAPNAIHSRMAATLAEPHGQLDGAGPARGGPGDRRTNDDTALTGEPAATGRRARVAAAPSGTPVRMVAVPMSMEPDPLTAAFRASAARPVAALAAAAAGGVGDVATSGVAIGDRPAARGGPATTTTGERAAMGTAASAAMGGGATGGGATASGAPDAGAATTPDAGPATPASSPAATPAASGPCAEERRVADERCAVATRAREGAAAAAESLRQAQRTYDEHVARAESGSALADPRAVRSAKEQAQQRFRAARNRAGTRDDVEAGAREWLAEINRINQATREATVAVEKDRAAAAALGPTVERLAVEADATRITSERADEACTAARDVVADCDEARTLEEAADRSADEPDAAEADAGGEGRIAAATPEPEDEFAFSSQMHSQGGQDALILRILRGEHDALQRAVARLAGDDADARRLWQTQLGGLAEALIARSIEAVAFDFPLEHPFWGPFNQAQNRDIAAGLSSLGFRFDGFGGWVDDRLPSQRDLSLAVGYAGLDPMRVRRWPTESETQDLLRDVRVAADEYVAGAAGGLTLGELVTLLGRRADGLTELWNAWGIVRPILLEAG